MKTLLIFLFAAAPLAAQLSIDSVPRGYAMRYELSAYTDDTGIEVVLEASDVFETITGWTVMQDNAWQADTAAGEFTVPASGMYSVHGSFSFSADAANRTAHIALFQDGVKQVNCSLEQKISAASVIENASWTGQVSLTQGATLTIRCEVESGTATFTFNHMQFNVERHP